MGEDRRPERAVEGRAGQDSAGLWVTWNRLGHLRTDWEMRVGPGFTTPGERTTDMPGRLGKGLVLYMQS